MNIQRLFTDKELKDISTLPWLENDTRLCLEQLVNVPPNERLAFVHKDGTSITGIGLGSVLATSGHPTLNINQVIVKPDKRGSDIGKKLVTQFNQKADTEIAHLNYMLKEKINAQ